MRRCALLLLFGLMLPVSADDVDRLLDAAHQQLAAGDAAAAERQFLEVIERFPGLAEPFDGLATALDAQGRRDEAVRMLLDVGQGLVAAEEIEIGLGYLERAADWAPEMGEAQAALGHALLQAQRHIEARDAFERALSLGLNAPAARLFLASAQWESGDYAAAEATYRALLQERQPNVVATARRALGALLVFQGRHADAVPTLMMAVGDAPELIEVRFDLARALEGEGRETEARELYLAIVDQAPDFQQAHYRLGRLFRKAQETERAAHHLQRFAQLQRDEQQRTQQAGRDEARLKRAWELFRAEQFEAALSQFRTLEMSADRLRGEAETLRRMGRHDAAIATLRRLLQADPSRSDIRLLIDTWSLETAS